MHYINYREAKKRGTMDFPVEFHHVSPSHLQHNMELHWHVEFELIRVLEGNLLLTIDEQEQVVPKNSVIFIPAGALHSGIPTDDCVYECIVFDINMLMNKSESCCKFIKKIIDLELKPRTIFFETYNDIHKIAWNLFDSLSSKLLGYELVVHGTLYQFFGAIISQGYFSNSPTHSSRDLKRIMQLKQALEFIESSYSSTISLQEISESVQMSPKYFCRFFQEMTHRTPIDYLNNYRIERACYLLLTTNQTITEIAYNTGFNDLSYFIKTFKKYKGTTPKQYLK